MTFSSIGETRPMEATFNTFGLGSKFSDLSFSVKQTSVDKAGYIKANYIPALLQLDGERHIQISYEVYPKTSVSLFSHCVIASEDKDLRNAIASYKAAAAAGVASAATAYGGLEYMTWSSSTSSGIAFSMKY